MNEATLLVESKEGEDGYDLQLTKDGIRIIESVPAEYDSVLLAIVGPGRAGKSSLLNSFVGDNVFKTGSSMKRVTEGIWIYVKFEHGIKQATMYFDVEGFGDPKKANTGEKDEKLLNVVCQICDVVMYNTKGVYNDDMMQKLMRVHFYSEISRKNNTFLSKPILIAVLRDFDLDPPDDPDVEFRDLFDATLKGKNVFQTFRELKAVQLVKPNEGKVKELHNVPDEKLEKEFVTERKRLEAYIKDKARPLHGNSNKRISGKVLAEALRKTVKAINDGVSLSFVKTLPEILNQKNGEIRKTALKAYEESLKEKWPDKSAQETLPDLEKKLSGCAVIEVQEKCFTVDYSVELKLEEFKEEMISSFEGISKEKCESAAKCVMKDIDAELSKDAYNTADGHKRFREDFEQAKEKYKLFRNLGPEKKKVWQAKEKFISEYKGIIADKASVKEKETKLEIDRKKIDEREQILVQKEKEIKDVANRIVVDMVRKYQEAVETVGGYSVRVKGIVVDMVRKYQEAVKTVGGYSVGVKGNVVDKVLACLNGVKTRIDTSMRAMGIVVDMVLKCLNGDTIRFDTSISIRATEVFLNPKNRKLKRRIHFLLFLFFILP